ncbi:hypothetical protein [Rhizobium sp. IMFF44]|uniref:hypothetical protein n=1 Tax=Rhizobium sp. IMFF44 TaxID=3342350 RepID=UPI0035BA6BFF
MEEELHMPGKGWLIGFADQSKRQCREQLRQNIAMAVEELLDDGWEPDCIAEALSELADDYMDSVIGNTAMHAPSRRTH